jgi:hypothetical protein
MADPDTPDPLEPATIEIEAEPMVAGRLARWVERARVLRTRVEASRARHTSVDLGFDVVERDSTAGGGLLAGALAYRPFVVLVPAALMSVAGLGLYSARRCVKGLAGGSARPPPAGFTTSPDAHP